MTRVSANQAQLEHTMATVVHERDHWKERVRSQANLLISLRKVADSSAQKLKAADERAALQQGSARRCNESLRAQVAERDAEIARLAGRVAENDAEIILLKNLSASYFARTVEVYNGVLYCKLPIVGFGNIGWHWLFPVTVLSGVLSGIRT